MLAQGHLRLLYDQNPTDNLAASMHCDINAATWHIHGESSTMKNNIYSTPFLSLPPTTHPALAGLRMHSCVMVCWLCTKVDYLPPCPCGRKWSASWSMKSGNCLILRELHPLPHSEFLAWLLSDFLWGNRFLDEPFSNNMQPQSQLSEEGKMWFGCSQCCIWSTCALPWLLQKGVRNQTCHREASRSGLLTFLTAL